MLLDSFEFLIHEDDRIENQGEQVNRIKATEFVAKLIFSSRNMKLLVTSSQNFEFPSPGKEKITQGANFSALENCMEEQDSVQNMGRSTFRCM